MNGTVGEMHAKKIVNLYRIALKTGCPVIGLIDCAGMRLEEASDALEAFGSIYMAQAEASGVIPQITGIFGSCGGGMAVVPALADFTFMESSKAKLFVNSPNALAGNIDSVCDTSTAAYQSTETGLADACGSEDEILQVMRDLVSILPANNEEDPMIIDTADDLNRACPDLAGCAGDPALFLPRISDDGFMLEMKADYGKDMVTAFIALDGMTVGAVANRRTLYDENGNEQESFDGLSPRGAKKAAAFVRFCDAFSIPVVTFTNISGYKASTSAERYMAKAAAQLIYEFAGATIPKVNVITQEAMGSAYLAMNSKAVGADIVYAWEGAKIGMMDGKAAAKILCDGEKGSVIAEKAKEYDALQNSVSSAAARGYVDTVIAPEDTRKYLIGAIEMLYSTREYGPDRKHGTV